IRHVHSYPTRRSSDLLRAIPLADGDRWAVEAQHMSGLMASWATADSPYADQLQRAARHLGRSASLKHRPEVPTKKQPWMRGAARSEEHTSELQSRFDL